MHPGNSRRSLGHLQKLALKEDVAAFAFEELGLDDNQLPRLDVTASVYALELGLGD